MTNSLRKSMVVISFIMVALLGVYLVREANPTGNVVVTDLKTSASDPANISFNIQHRFSEARECYADVFLYSNGNTVDKWTEELGKIEPGKKSYEEIVIDFPPGETDYDIKIDCK